MNDLLSRWHATLAALQRTGPLVEELGRDLLHRWDEPQRHYHTLAHLRTLLDLVSGAAATVVLAVWFHDAIYDPRSSQNEAESAQLAREQLARLTLDPDQIDEVVRLVLLTRTHTTSPDDEAGQLLLDADLAILGEKSETYDAYAAAIRREYDWVTESAYRQGRAEVLTRFLEREHLYFTERFRASHEERARANLLRELAALN